MPTLTVRNVEDEIVHTLKQCAAEAGIPAAELHRRILRRALLRPRRTVSELVAALRHLGELGLEIEPDRRSAPPRVAL